MSHLFLFTKEPPETELALYHPAGHPARGIQ